MTEQHWEPPAGADPRRPVDFGPSWPVWAFIIVMSLCLLAMILWSWAMNGWR